MTVRQNALPVGYSMSRRPDNASILTTGKAGEVIPVSFAPLFRGDSVSGRIIVNMALAEMSKPIENAVIGRAQVWVIPRPALPQFGGIDEYVHSYHGTDATALGRAARTPASLFATVSSGAIAAAQASEFFRALGLHLEAGAPINTDYIDSYALVQNFRLAAHSSKMTRYPYYAENAVTSLELKPAFWPTGRMHQIVPDYEQALVVGSLDLDVSAGNVSIVRTDNAAAWNLFKAGTNTKAASGGASIDTLGHPHDSASSDLSFDPNGQLYGDVAGQTITTSLAAIDSARTTNAFAKLRAQYAGTNFSGFNNDDVIVADLMQGFEVPAELFNRPWLADSKTITFGMKERPATDGASLDQSVTTGKAQVALSVNVPKLKHGGLLMVTVEVMPERLYERQRDEYLYCTTADDLPNALRDIQRAEPVDTVRNSRIDQAHTTPAGVFGYEPMNAKWKRSRTTLGGEFRQTTPGTPITTARTAIWQADYVDPAYTSDHWLVPHPFPQDVFAAPGADAISIACMHSLAITGLTQMGDDLVEDNNEFDLVAAEVA